MQKKTISYIEDYIEILAGYVGIKGKTMSFSLARYDVQIVTNLADQTNRGIGYTDKQALLAHKLVVKYKRQFAKYDIDIGFHEENGHFRLPIRYVDRSKTIKLTDGQVYLRFPYESKMIDEIKDSGKNIPGLMKFDREQKAWIMSITEPRILWLQTIADKYQFEMDPDISKFVDNINETKQLDYQIVLEKTDQGLIIRNGEPSLIDYIEKNLNGLNEDNLVTLVDYSNILGYSVSDEIRSWVESKYNQNQTMLLSLKETHLPIKDDDSFRDIVEYAGITNRWPLYVFENIDTNTGRMLPILKEYFTGDELVEVPLKSRTLKLSPNVKCVYLNHWMHSWQTNIPMLVTLTSLMIGPKKQHIVQNSEKIVYCTDVMIKYNQQLTP